MSLPTESYIDANIVLYFVTGEPEHLHTQVLDFFERAEAGQFRIMLLPVSVAEVIYVLRLQYDYPRKQIRESLIAFMDQLSLLVADYNELQLALDIYLIEPKLDFADAYLAAKAAHADKGLITYDKALLKVDTKRHRTP